jgi:glucan 1,3-beta-glucosidase
MRLTTFVAVTALAGSTVAAPTPTPGPITDLFAHVAQGLKGVVENLNLKLHTDGFLGGPVLKYHQQCPFSMPKVESKPDRYHHDIPWAKGVSNGDFINWRTFKANGANLGGWLAKEKTHDPIWWDSVGGADAPDEWTLCQKLSKNCGPTFEARYASFLNTTTIDQLASVGVNTLRIPTTYAAWVSVPGSQFYKGKQQDWLRKITQYAIEKYQMHGKSLSFHFVVIRQTY